jgi:hypothetical protein
MNGLPPAGTITTCTDYGMGFTTVLAQQSCSAGMYSTDPCPAANRVGRCMISGPCDASTVSYYAPTTLMQAQMECTYLYRQPYTAFFTPG